MVTVRPDGTKNCPVKVPSARVFMLVVFSAGNVPIVSMTARLAVCVKPLPVAVTRVPAGPWVGDMVTEAPTMKLAVAVLARVALSFATTG